MNLTINNSFEFGQKLYRLTFKYKVVYKPCTLCNNTRKVTIKDPDSGEEFYVTCPKCEGRHIKGDYRNKISVKSYSMEHLEIEEIVITQNEVYARLTNNSYRSSTVHLLPDDQRTVLVEESTGFSACGEVTRYYTSKQECQAEMRRLNKLEKNKVEEFLKEV